MQNTKAVITAVWGCLATCRRYARLTPRHRALANRPNRNLITGVEAGPNLSYDPY